MKKVLLTVFSITIGSMVSAQVVTLPNAKGFKRSVQKEQNEIPHYTAQARNYNLNFKEKSYYGVELGQFVSDHNILVREGKNELDFFTNQNGLCWKITDRIYSADKSGPEDKHYQVIANKLYPEGKWVSGYVGRYSGIYCVEDKVKISVCYTGNDLIVEYSDVSLQSESILKEKLQFLSVDDFLTYQDKLGSTPEARAVTASLNRKESARKKENLIAQEIEFKKERSFLVQKIKSLNNIFFKIDNIYSFDKEKIKQIERMIPSMEDYQALRKSVDDFNNRVAYFMSNAEKGQYVQKIKIHSENYNEFDFLTAKLFNEKINWAKERIKKHINDEKIYHQRQAENQKRYEEREQALKQKYGAKYLRYKKEGFYTGMNIDFVKDLVQVLVPKNIENGIKYYLGGNNKVFGFKDNKLVYYSGY